MIGTTAAAELARMERSLAAALTWARRSEPVVWRSRAAEGYRARLDELHRDLRLLADAADRAQTAARLLTAGSGAP